MVDRGICGELFSGYYWGVVLKVIGGFDYISIK